VAGTFNHWEPQALTLQLASEGDWETELALPPGDYEYRFIVDGKWEDDPLACRVVANPYGGVNAVLHVHDV
jgi:1,4-alpha-glucan branching enzyme